MLLTIYDRYGTKKTELSPNDSSTQSKELQSDNMLSLTFTLYEHISLDVNDYTDFEGERYWMTEAYQPTQKSSVEWEYNVKMYGIESLIKRFLVLKTTDGENEPVFTLTAPPKDHVALIVKCINDGMGGITNWKVGAVEGTENIVVDYQGTYCDEALKKIAETVGTEYWIEGQTVNLCRCEHGEELTIGYGNGLLEPSKDTASNVKFYTRLFPIGSTRNIDRDKYGYSRLQLPDKSRYVDVNTDKYGIIHHYEADAFADIYPRRIGTVSSVRSEEKKGEDGNPFTIYYFKDDSLPFDPNEFEIGGKVKRVSFQDGELAGMGEEEDGSYYFECNYNSKTKEFEIITIWPYDDDTQLPGSPLVPKTGNQYILWNISMPPMYYNLAEEEFRTAVDKYNEDNAIDVAVYKGSTDHVWVEDGAVDLFVGRRVRLESKEFFPGTGYRSSRITKITRNVNVPGKADIEISDALGKGAMDKLSGEINDAKNYSKGLLGNTILPDIIRSWDTTLPTDTNLFSARRTKKEFASKINEDTFQKKMRFLEGLDISNYIQGVQGGHIDADGNAEFANATVRDLLKVDRLEVLKEAVFSMLTVKELRHVGGTIVLSSASMECVRVEDTGTAYRCYFRADDGERSVRQEFAAGDQAICQTFNIKEGTSYQVSNKYYWRLVTAVGNDYIDLSKTDCDSLASGGADNLPAASDEIVQLGNRTDSARQNAIILSTIGDDAPSVKQYAGIDGYSLGGKEVTILSPSLNRMTGDFITSSGVRLGDAVGSINTLSSTVQSLTDDLAGVKEQTEQEYTLWFYDYAPTADNEPASLWTTYEQRTQHDQDLFYDRTTGRGYRYTGGQWVGITDAMTVKALQDASEAKHTADECAAYISNNGSRIEAVVGRFNDDGSLKNTAGLVTGDGTFASLFAAAVEEDDTIAKKAELTSFVGKTADGHIETGVKIGADNIELEGVVTANGNFRILEDGSIEAINGTFRGNIGAETMDLKISTNEYPNPVDGAALIAGPWPVQVGNPTFPPLPEGTCRTVKMIVYVGAQGGYANVQLHPGSPKVKFIKDFYLGEGLSNPVVCLSGGVCDMVGIHMTGEAFTYWNIGQYDSVT